MTSYSEWQDGFEVEIEQNPYGIGETLPITTTHQTGNRGVFGSPTFGYENYSMQEWLLGTALVGSYFNSELYAYIQPHSYPTYPGAPVDGPISSEFPFMGNVDPTTGMPNFAHVYGGESQSGQFGIGAFATWIDPPGIPGAMHDQFQVTAAYTEIDIGYFSNLAKQIAEGSLPTPPDGAVGIQWENGSGLPDWFPIMEYEQGHVTVWVPESNWKAVEPWTMRFAARKIAEISSENPDESVYAEWLDKEGELYRYLRMWGPKESVRNDDGDLVIMQGEGMVEVPIDLSWDTAWGEYPDTPTSPRAILYYKHLPGEGAEYGTVQGLIAESGAAADPNWSLDIGVEDGGLGGEEFPTVAMPIGTNVSAEQRAAWIPTLQATYRTPRFRWIFETAEVTTAPPLRQRQRDDNWGMAAGARLNMAKSSKQYATAPRVGDKNTYS